MYLGGTLLLVTSLSLAQLRIGPPAALCILRYLIYSLNQTNIQIVFAPFIVIPFYQPISFAPYWILHSSYPSDLQMILYICGLSSTCNLNWLGMLFFMCVNYIHAPRPTSKYNKPPLSFNGNDNDETCFHFC